MWHHARASGWEASHIEKHRPGQDPLRTMSQDARP